MGNWQDEQRIVRTGELTPSQHAALLLETFETRLNKHRTSSVCKVAVFEDCEHCGGREMRKQLAQVFSGIIQALNRYDDPSEKHNKQGGFPRGEIAWAMASDLREAKGILDAAFNKSGT